MMMSVLQEIKGLTKKLYFIILLVRRPVPMQNFRLKVYKVYLFWHRYSLHYNVLSGPTIISLSRSKGVNGKIICLCTSSDENLFTCKISGQKLLHILSYASSWRSRRSRRWICENHVYLYFIPHVIFSSHFLHAVTFLPVLHLEVLRRQIETETESENWNILMYGYIAGPPMAIPIYTVLPYCVILELMNLLHHTVR